MTARLVRTPDGMACWDRQSLIETGYEPVGTVVEIVTLQGRQELAYSLGVTMDSLECFRLPTGQWEYFYALEVTKTDRMEPLLPKW